MFNKYIGKITNSIGTVHFMQSKIKNKHTMECKKTNKIDEKRCSHSNSESSVDSDEEHNQMNQMMAKDLGSTTPLLMLPTAQIIISTALAELRRTLLFYPLVYLNEYFFF